MTRNGYIKYVDGKLEIDNNIMDNKLNVEYDNSLVSNDGYVVYLKPGDGYDGYADYACANNIVTSNAVGIISVIGASGLIAVNGICDVYVVSGDYVVGDKVYLSDDPNYKGLITKAVPSASGNYKVLIGIVSTGLSSAQDGDKIKVLLKISDPVVIP